MGRRGGRLSATIAAGAALLVGCTTQVEGTPSSPSAGPDGPTTIATKPAQPVMDRLRGQGYDCGQATVTPAPVWQCFAHGAEGVSRTFTFQLRADGTTGGFLVYVTPEEVTGDALPKQVVDEVIEGLLPQVLDEPQLRAVQDWVVRAPYAAPSTVQGLQLDYSPTSGGGGKFEFLAPGTQSLRAVDATAVLSTTMPEVQLSAVQAFAESNEMTCDAGSSGSISCAQEPLYFRSINATPGGGANGGVDLATFRFRTGDRADAVALFTEFATVVSPDGAAATGEWLGRRLGSDGRFSTAALEGVTFTIEVDRSGSDPEYAIGASPSLF